MEGNNCTAFLKVPGRAQKTCNWQNKGEILDSYNDEKREYNSDNMSQTRETRGEEVI